MNILGFIAQTIRIAVPYLFAAAGGIISERAGLIALTLEGFMLGGAFGAMLGAFYFHSALAGLVCGALAAILLAMIHGLATVKWRGDQVVIGIAVNLLAIGATRFFLRFLFDSSSNSPRIVGISGVRESGGLVAALTNPMVWLGVLSIVLVWAVIYRTPFGLRLRAVGEHPEAAASLGVSVRKVRFIALALAGALAGLGGVHLALDAHQFSDQMTAGRGFIALAAVIFGRWEPKRVALACFLFAAAETLQIQLQARQAIPSQFVEMIPYVLTIIALAGVVGRAVPPMALGRAAD